MSYRFFCKVWNAHGLERMADRGGLVRSQPDIPLWIRRAGIACTHSPLGCSAAATNAILQLAEFLSASHVVAFLLFPPRH